MLGKRLCGLLQATLRKREENFHLLSFTHSLQMNEVTEFTQAAFRTHTRHVRPCRTKTTHKARRAARAHISYHLHCA